MLFINVSLNFNVLFLKIINTSKYIVITLSIDILGETIILRVYKFQDTLKIAVKTYL